MIGLPSISMPALPKIGSSGGTSKALKLAAPIGSIVISAIVLIFVIWPTFGRVINLNVSNKQLVVRTQSLESKVEALSSLDRRLLDRQLSASEQLLPSDKGVFSLVSQIEKEASASGVLLDKIDVAPGNFGDSLTLGQSADTNVQTATQQGASGAQASADLGDLSVSTPKVAIKVSISSDFQGLLRFINAMDVLPRVISIHDFTIVSSGSGSGIGTRLTIDAFWEPIPRELPAVETPITPLTDSESRILDNVKFAVSEAGPLIGGEGGVSVPTGKSDIFAPF